MRLLQSHIQVAVLLPEAREEAYQSGYDGGQERAGGDRSDEQARGEVVGYERSVLSVQDLREQVSELLFRS